MKIECEHMVQSTQIIIQNKAIAKNYLKWTEYENDKSLKIVVSFIYIYISYNIHMYLQ